MSELLLIYVVGAGVTALVCGVVLAGEIVAEGLIGLLILTFLWPIALPLLVGASLIGRN